MATPEQESLDEISKSSGSSGRSEESLNISFENIHHTVRRKLFSRSRKSILNGICGSFEAGELSVIIGQSGAGKSTLMDILAGYTKPTTGKLLVNGRIRDDNWFRRRSCYIMQDDMLQEMLTAHECVKVAADLKLGSHISKSQKKQRVYEILKALGLYEYRNTKAGKLSGGQKKRLAIGLELVSDPPVMFLDEPTSGLDSFTTKQVIYLLHVLAKQGRTIVITIHQPSATLFPMIDKVYAVLCGKCAYSGTFSQLENYLENLNLKCPPFHNPVDFFIEVCSDNAERMIESVDNGKSTKWQVNLIPENGEEILNEQSWNDNNNQLTALPSPSKDETSKILLKLKSTYATSILRQINTLTKRALLTIWRDRSFTFSLFGIHCAMGLLLGIMFYSMGDLAEHIRTNYNYLFFSLMFLSYTAFSGFSVYFPQRLPLVRREHFNRWYSTGAYYLATIVSSLPLQTACVLAYALISYWMTGQPFEALRFFKFTWTLLLTSYVAISIGLLNGSVFTTKNAVVFGPFFLMPFVVFSGFFLRLKDAPFYVKWMYTVSFFKHGLAGLLETIYGSNRLKLPCHKDYCHITQPKNLLKEFELNGEKFYVINVFLFLIAAVTIAITFIILKIRLKSKW